MTEIVGVRFKKVGKIYYFDPAGIKFAVGERVVVETSRGVEIGEVAIANRSVEENEVVAPLRPVLRAATKNDLETEKANLDKAKEALKICAERVAKHGLDMQLVDAEYTFDGSKILFYFTSEGRVDFRDLVKDLAGVFKMRIELRQIGVRDEAKMCGGLGICGRPFCCSTFLDDFQPVSIKMAKEQSLSLNPTKISGTCGRLMCCLKYEQDAYEELMKSTPAVESKVITPDGEGTVVEVNLLRGVCKVALSKNPDVPKSFHKSECKVVRGHAKPKKQDEDEKLVEE